MTKRRKSKFLKKLKQFIGELGFKLATIAVIAIVGGIFSEIARHTTDNHIISTMVAAITAGLAGAYNSKKA